MISVLARKRYSNIKNYPLSEMNENHLKKRKILAECKRIEAANKNDEKTSRGREVYWTLRRMISLVIC